MNNFILLIGLISMTGYAIYQTKIIIKQERQIEIKSYKIEDLNNTINQLVREKTALEIAVDELQEEVEVLNERNNKEDKKI